MIAVLMHTGRMILRNSPPSGCIGVSAFFRVLPVPTKTGNRDPEYFVLAVAHSAVFACRSLLVHCAISAQIAELERRLHTALLAIAALRED
jgi:hypothetical protein